MFFLAPNQNIQLTETVMSLEAEEEADEMSDNEVAAAVRYFTVRAVVPREDSDDETAQESLVVSAADVEAAIALVSSMAELGLTASPTLDDALDDSAAGENHSETAAVAKGGSLVDDGNSSETTPGFATGEPSATLEKNNTKVTASAPADVSGKGSDSGALPSDPSTNAPTLPRDAGDSAAGISGGSTGPAADAPSSAAPPANVAKKQAESSANPMPPSSSAEKKSDACNVSSASAPAAAGSAAEEPTAQQPPRPADEEQSAAPKQQPKTNDTKVQGESGAAAAAVSVASTADGGATPSKERGPHQAKEVPVVPASEEPSAPVVTGRASVGKRPRSPSSTEAPKRPRPSLPPAPPVSRMLESPVDGGGPPPASSERRSGDALATGGLEASIACPGVVVWAPRGDGEILPRVCHVECVMLRAGCIFYVVSVRYHRAP